MSETGTNIQIPADQNGSSHTVVARDYQHRLPIVNYNRDVSLGNVANEFGFEGFGYKTTATPATVDVWDGPTATIPFPPDEGIQMQVVSSSAEDSAAGTGIRSLYIIYLDADGNTQAELITMNGATPVLTTATDIRFLQFTYTATAGSVGEAVGTISIQSVGGVTTYGVIIPGQNRSISSARMIPAGMEFCLEFVNASATSKDRDPILAGLYATSLNGVRNADDIFYMVTQGSYANSTVHAHIDTSPVFPELTKIKVKATFTGNTNATAIGHYVGVLRVSVS